MIVETSESPARADGSKAPRVVDSLDNQSVQSGRLGDLWGWRVLQVFLLPFPSSRVLVSEDKVDLVGRPAFVGTKHDGEGGLRAGALALGE